MKNEARYNHLRLNRLRFKKESFAVVVELVDTPDSKSGFERSDGSSPSSGTKQIEKPR